MAKVVVALLDHNVQEGKNLQAYLQEKPDIVWQATRWLILSLP